MICLRSPSQGMPIVLSAPRARPFTTPCTPSMSHSRASLGFETTHDHNKVSLDAGLEIMCEARMFRACEEHGL